MGVSCREYVEDEQDSRREGTEYGLSREREGKRERRTGLPREARWYGASMRPLRVRE